jgi:hypothetical protein
MHTAREQPNLRRTNCRTPRLLTKMRSCPLAELPSDRASDLIRIRGV